MDDLVTDPAEIRALVQEGVVLGRICPICQCRSVTRGRKVCETCWQESQDSKWHERFAPKENR